MSALRRTFNYLLTGADRAVVDRLDGRPCPAVLTPELLAAFLDNTPYDVTFAPTGLDAFTQRIEDVRIAALLPSPDGFCRCMLADFDAAADHAGGLVDADRAVFAFAERLDRFGLFDGALFSKSRRGNGWHCLIVHPPVPLRDATITAAYLLCNAVTAATLDTAETGIPFAFRGEDGSTRIGPGAVELFPPSDTAPALGWNVRLPRTPVDPWTGTPIDIDGDGLIIASRDAVTQAIIDAHRSMKVPRPAKPKRRATKHRDDRDPFARCDERTRAFLRGEIPEGERNKSLFASTCNAIAVGIPFEQVEAEFLAAATRVGLPEREALTTIRSAARSVT